MSHKWTSLIALLWHSWFSPTVLYTPSWWWWRQIDVWQTSMRHNCDRGVPWMVFITQHHDDVIKWKHFPRYWPFVRGIHRSPVNSQHKGQWRRALMFSLIWAWINGWVNNGEAGELRRHRAHYDVTVMIRISLQPLPFWGLFPHTSGRRQYCHWFRWLLVAALASKSTETTMRSCDATVMGGLCLPWGWLTTVCAISISRNDNKCK